MRVELLYHAPESPEKYIAMVMRRTRDASPIEQIKTEIDKKGSQEKLVRLAMRSKHYGVLEHITYWFNVEQVSRVLTHQLVRHRIASYAQLSGRKLNVDNGYVVPPLDYVSNNQQRIKLQRFFERKFKAQFKDYRWLVENGVRVEDARYLLPNGQWTCIMIALNARSLMHIIKIRRDPNAQWEIRELAEHMWDLVKDTAPVLFESIPPDI